MHIPPYYKRSSWQRFFSGCVIGSILAYLIFLFIYGRFYEEWVEENLYLRSQLRDLEKNYQTLEENHLALDKKSKENILIEEVNVQFENLKALKLQNDRMMVHQLEEAVKQEIEHIIGKEIDVVSETVELLITSVENKRYKVDEFYFQAEINTLILSNVTVVKINLNTSNS
ncbi:sporulation membrane protein YtrI [Saliterribacillus persicus]|uniref:Sporulation membrane protein YtrI C-terminal domain-containing protein n=1 Tax=Saliterribacillus persicus TaxID=930114 RepID=A0A368XIK0_9BACI|nr:sporulation membrane protein YtrI [Saliterribacillus persicus]RCW66307.1 hypothetical protein DFR57_10922 [Saliterribacillus persicus]